MAIATQQSGGARLCQETISLGQLSYFRTRAEPLKRTDLIRQEMSSAFVERHADRSAVDRRNVGAGAAVSAR